MSPEKPARRPLVWILAAAFVCVVGLMVWAERQKPRLAEEAVRNVAGEAEMLWVVEARTPGRRSSLWCGAVARPDGLVAVSLRTRLPFPPTVREVAPAWVVERSPEEARMLDKCWERVR